MKQFTFRTLLAVTTASLLFTACKDENDDGNTSKTTYEFSVKAEDNPIDAPADGKTYTILVTSTKTAQAGTSAVAYEVVSSPEWAPAELEQTALVITVAKNSSTEAREPGKVVLKQDESDKTLEITINQAGFSNSMSLEATYSTDRCKVLLIEPAITGFDQNPVYKWTVKGPNDAEAAEAGTDKTLSFIQLKTGDYIVSLTVTDDSSITETKSATVTVATEATAYSPYISEVLEYKPTPATKLAQYSINPTINSYSSALATAKDVLIGKEYKEQSKGINIGTFGGSIVFKFDHTIINVPGYRDFSIRSFETKTSYPAQGIVMVAFDKNGNGEPDDDEWYELAGSEHRKVTVQKNITVTYERPSTFSPSYPMSEYIRWTLSNKETGWLAAPMQMGTDYTQIWPYWLQTADEGKTIEVSGLTMLQPLFSCPGGFMVTTKDFYDYGYVCNGMTQDETAASFDIDWAVDANEQAIKLPGIDFVKVYTANMPILGDGYGTGFCSINSAYDLHLAGKEIETIAQ